MEKLTRLYSRTFYPRRRVHLTFGFQLFRLLIGGSFCRNGGYTRWGIIVGPFSVDLFVFPRPKHWTERAKREGE